MRVAVIGLGYVGTTTAACLAAAGHQIVGVDVNPLKAEMIGRGESPIIEEGITERLSEAVAAGRLRATGSAADAVAVTEISLICVGTPSRANGSLDLEHLLAATRTVGEALAVVEHYHVVAVRSTMLPGTLEEQVVPVLEEASGKRAGPDFGVAVNPEFLREGDAVRDFTNPPFTLIGEFDERSGETLAGLYRKIEAPLVRTEVRVAEGVKYASNIFHALKISFANEMGVLLRSLGVDPYSVLDIFKMDTRLNISGAYLRPGFAFGGSCLPKDLRAALHAAKSHDLDLPVLGSILPGNEAHLRRGVEMIVETGKKKVGILGFSFKAGTDDLRESPMVMLVEALLGKGFDLKIYDRDVSLARLVGANKEYIETAIPHIASLMSDEIDEVIGGAEGVVIGTADPDFAAIPARLGSEIVVVDLIRVGEDPSSFGPGYRGISW
ncbi:MAG: nucleotide sugar dehydrogenase [Actinobacteria bacterium]|nr:nucleotide sugar dehydrogenase [Actinomycetota bacterium]